MDIKQKIADLRASASKHVIAARDKIASYWNKSGRADTEPMPYGQKLFIKTISIAAAGAAVTAAVTNPVTIFGQELSFTWLWIWGSLAYIGFSFRFSDPIGPDELAVRTFFGDPTDVLQPGLPFIPLGLFEIQKLPKTTIQREFPAEPEKIYDGDGEVPPGKKPPIRLPFGESIKDEDSALSTFGKDFEVLDIHKIYGTNWSTKTYEELDELEAIERQKHEGERKLIKFIAELPKKDGISHRVTANVTPVVSWQIENAVDFIQNVSPLETEETKSFTVTEKLIAEMNKRIEDEMIIVLTRLLQKMSLAQALNNVDWINAHLYFAVIKRTLGWGIRVDRAAVKPFGQPKRVNEAIANKAAADYQGSADKELAIKRGEGAAQASHDLQEKTLAGRAAGYRKLKEETGLSGEQVLAGEIAGRIADGGNAVVVGADGFSQLAGVAAAALKPKPAPEKKGAETQE